MKTLSPKIGGSEQQIRQLSGQFDNELEQNYGTREYNKLMKYCSDTFVEINDKFAVGPFLKGQIQCGAEF